MTKRDMMKYAHRIAKKMEGDYTACLALALRKVWVEQKVELERDARIARRATERKAKAEAAERQADEERENGVKVTIEKQTTTHKFVAFWINNNWTTRKVHNSNFVSETHMKRNAYMSILNGWV